MFYGAVSARINPRRWQRPLSSLVEHFLGKEEVVGPIPTGGSVLRRTEQPHRLPVRLGRAAG
jgi:hypothetical protein